MVGEMGDVGQAGPGLCREAVLLRARMRAQGHVDVRLNGRCMEPLLVAGDWARVHPPASMNKAGPKDGLGSLRGLALVRYEAIARR